MATKAHGQQEALTVATSDKRDKILVSSYLPQNVSLALNCTKRAPRVEVNAPKLVALILVEIPMKFV